MKYFKILFQIILLLAIVLAVNYFILKKYNIIALDAVPIWSRLFPCSEPIGYSLGNIDSRFELSNAEVLARLREAEDAWEKSVGKNVLEYDTEGKLKIDFVFDDRQERTIAQDKLSANLGKLEANHDKLIDNYKSLNNTYIARTEAYKKSVDEYEDRLTEYNQDVSKWNRNPGTKKEYEQLKNDKEDLREMFEKLEEERQAINKLAGETNKLVSEEEKLVDTYNSSLHSYINRYGASKEFDQGLYDGSESSITIFQFHDQADLRLVLAHEMGHALGIGHLSNPTSVMYYLMGEQDMDSLQLTEEDVSALKNVCRIK